MRLATKIIVCIAVLWLGFMALGAGLYYWKESVPHYEAGALGTTMALHTMQENYKRDHDGYADNFSELGSLLGAHLSSPSEMHYEGYVFQFTETQRDEQGHIVAYAIVGQPEAYRFRCKRSFLLTNRGEIHYTDANRAATVNDRLLR